MALPPPQYIQSLFDTYSKGFVLQCFSNKINFEAFCQRAVLLRYRQNFESWVKLIFSMSMC